MNRLDRELAARGLVRSRTEAQELIETGQVTVDGVAAGKPSLAVDSDSVIVVNSRLPYVSRGGIKLAAALDVFGIAAQGRTALDLGSSTGGFTDCLLQRGASRVVAVDIGHGQMAPSVADDSRVELREGVNVRDLLPGDFDGVPDIIAADLSFISMTLVMDTVGSLAGPETDIIVLIKPQFEVGAGALGKNGVVRDAGKRRAAANRVLFAADAAGLRRRGLIDSPIAGGSGNLEYLGWFRKGESLP